MVFVDVLFPEFHENGGGFNTNGTFQFSFSSVSNCDYDVYASTNLGQLWDESGWQNIGSATLSGTNTQGAFVDTNAASFNHRFYMIAQAGYYGQTNGSSVYGYTKLALPAGDWMISNPFLSSNMNISALLSSVPQSTTLKFWGETNWTRTATFSSGAWDQPDWPLVPGDGAMIHAPTNVTLTFVGQVVEGAITNILPAGFSVRSSIFAAPNVDELGLVITNGDYIQKWDGTQFICYTNNGTHLTNCLWNCLVRPTWAPTEPSLAPGDAFIIHTATNRVWGGVSKASEVYALRQPVAGSDYGDDLYVEWPWAGLGLSAPPGSFIEIDDSDSVGSYLAGYYITITDEIMDYDEQTLFDNIYNYSVGSHGVMLRLRFREGNVCGPWSDWVQY